MRLVQLVRKKPLSSSCRIQEASPVWMMRIVRVGVDEASVTVRDSSRRRSSQLAAEPGTRDDWTSRDMSGKVRKR